jgi:hypothetical protein
MSWEGIRLVTSGLTLIAFVVLAALFAYRRRLKSQERLLLKGGPKDRGYVQSVLAFFDVDTSRLTPDGAFNLALEQVRAKDRANRRLVVASVIIVAILAALTAYSFVIPPPTQKAAEASGSLGALSKGLASANSDVVLTLATPDLQKFWFEPVSAADEWALLQKLCAANSCLACEPSVVGPDRKMTIGLNGGSAGQTEEFSDRYGDKWMRCAT